MDKAIAMARQAIESTYKGLCTIEEYREVTNPITEETRTEKVVVVKGQPCKLSKKTIGPAEGTDVANNIQYAPVLFINPNIEVRPGSAIMVIQHGVTRQFTRSGEPFVYETHQEIPLQRSDRA